MSRHELFHLKTGFIKADHILHHGCSSFVLFHCFTDSTEANASLALKMMARIVFQMLTWLILFQAGDVALSATTCHLCSLSNQLLQKVNDLNKGQSAIKGLIGQIIKPACKFDFEGGINGWTTSGTAFSNQPTYGDNPTARNRGQPASHQGDWWIGGYEYRPYKSYPGGRIQGDGPLGTLTSPYFTIRGPFISFLIGGGCHIHRVRAELIIGSRVVFKETGKCTETMTSKTWHVGTFVGQRARVRLIDFSSGGWGHINFDDLRGDISCE